MAKETIPQKQWDEAEAYFRTHPKDTHFASFIKIKGSILAVSKNQLGKGASGTYFLCQDKKGNQYALRQENKTQVLLKTKREKYQKKAEKIVKHLFEKKISPTALGFAAAVNADLEFERSVKWQAKRQKKITKYEQREYKISRKLGIALSQIIKHQKSDLPQNKPPLRRTFTLHKKLEGSDLETQKKNNEFSTTTKQVIGLHAIKEIAKLHQNRILHRDIKPANFMLNLKETPMSVTVIDFGQSKQLRRNQKVARSAFTFGTPTFQSPEIMHDNLMRYMTGLEIKKNNTFSFQSDIYALGVMLQDPKWGMGLTHPEIINKMQSHSLKDRPSLNTVFNEMTHALIKSLDFKEQITNIAQAIYEMNPKKLKNPTEVRTFLYSLSNSPEAFKESLKSLDFSKLTSQIIRKVQNQAKQDNQNLSEATHKEKSFMPLRILSSAHKSLFGKKEEKSISTKPTPRKPGGLK